MRPSTPQYRMMPAQEGEADTTGLIDVQYVKDIVGFMLRSIRRHPFIVAAVFLAIVGTAAGAFMIMPRQYLVHTSLFAQRNFVMPALGNPRRAVPLESDVPTRLARESVMKRDNLVAIVKQTDLLRAWEETRPPVLRLKDRAVRLVKGEPTEQDKLDALVATLERRMWVITNDGTVEIGVLWPDAHAAYRIVDVAQRNFIEERHASEIATIQESITILERQTANARATIDEGYRELRRELAVPARAQASRRNAANDERIATLRSTLTAKRLAIADLEGFQRRRLGELQTRLAEQRNTYGPRHPALTSTEQSIAELSEDSPQLAQLRREERQLASELRSLGVDPDALPTAGPPATFGESLAHAAIASLSQARDDSVRAERASYARARVQMAEHEYEDLLQRLQGAHIELETARAAFKYRYGVITPPLVPKRAMRPKPVIFVAGGLGLGVLMAVFAAVATDIGRGRVVESWQVERLLGLKVLREVSAP